MAPASDSPDGPQRATSSEPGSTRANPFDDTDASSRKRRRTTASSSPIHSPDTAHALEPLDSSPITAADGPAPVAVSPAPRTPEHQMASADPTTEPTSSKVTINLRNAPLSDTMSTSSSISPRSEAALPMPQPDEPQESVELGEGTVSQETYGTRLDVSTPSSLDSATPPMELLTEVDEDNEMGPDGLNGDGAVTDIDQTWGDPMADPIHQFPFRDSAETICDTVQNLVQYFTTHATIDPTFIDQISEWIEMYLRYANRFDRRAAMDTCRENRDFWLAFPDVLFAMMNRRATLHNVEDIRDAFVHVYAAFIKLTVGFVGIDRAILSEYHPTHGHEPELFSIGYLTQVHALLRRYDSESDAGHLLGPNRAEILSVFVSKLGNVAGGSLQGLGTIATAIVDLIPTHPRLAGALAPISQVAGDVVRESRRIVVSGHQGLLQAGENLEMGHNFWKMLSDSLAKMIEKHVTSLGSDSTCCQIQALTEILKLCLQADHKLAVTTTSTHRQVYPRLPREFTAEAIAWQWRFDVLGKLIRSSQMQLRVMALTTMCSELVSIWKRYYEGGDESSNAFLRHIGEYLLHNNLIEYILSPNCHPEIVADSANIIGFLVVTKLYRPEHTDRLWHGITSSQDPRVTEALARMITTFTGLLDYSSLLGLCEKLQTLPVDGFNSSIRMVWDSVLHQLVTRCNAEQKTLSFQPYDLCLRLLRESSVCASGSQVAHPEMQHSAMQKFRELLAYGPDANGRQMLYQSCIDDISARSLTTLGSLSCLSMAIRPGLAAELHLLTEQHDLARLIVEELEHAVEAGRAAGVLAVLSGVPNSPRKDFVTNIILFQPASIDNQLGERLWNILVGPQSPCQEDRNAGWQILIGVLRQKSLANSFLQASFSKYLPTLPSSCFCEGTHGFAREHILSLVDNNSDFVFDDEAEVARSGIEQLWRIILAADDVGIVQSAIGTLALDVYIESKSIKAYPFHRTQQVHLLLVDRCLRQLREAARKIKAFNDGSTSGDDESMVVVATEDQIREQERMFTRSLKLLRYFLETHQSKPAFAAPDLRSLMPHVPQEVVGESAQLKYQSFDGTRSSGILPLSIGKLNSAASLLASLKRETGFGNYRVYYRGRPFHPSERDVVKSLEDLCIQDGLILVKREEDGEQTSVRIKPGSSTLEIEILSHFEEMWEYLSMDVHLAKEIYDFLVKLPADGHIIDLFENGTASHRDMFPPGQPFRSLYAVHALVELLQTARQAVSGSVSDVTTRETSRQAYADVLRKSACIVVQAISDEAVLDTPPRPLQMTLTCSLMHTFVHLLQELHESGTPFSSDSVGSPSATRLVEIVSNAASTEGADAFPLMTETLVAICQLGLMDTTFWASITPDPIFVRLVHSLALFDPRKHVRMTFLQIVENILKAEGRSALEIVDTMKDETASGPLAQFFWSIASDLILRAAEFPHQSHEIFRIFHVLLIRLSNEAPTAVDFHRLAGQASQTLLDHTSTEQIGQDIDDPIANGFTSILQICLRTDDSLPNSESLPDDLALELFWTHLFPDKRSRTEASVQKVILNCDTRSKLCDIVFRLVRHDRRQFAMLLKAVNGMVPYYKQDDEEPYLYELPNQFDRSNTIRAPCGYVGMRNLSNTCYLNSLLTQLFMNTGFRSFVLQSTASEHADTQLLFCTQKLFGYMQESYRRYIDPTELVLCIKTYDDTPIDIHSQMDVDEFYSLLFDRWEGQLATDTEKKRLRSFYGGQLVQQVKSKECEHISERLEPFSAIQCDIKGKSTLQESLQAYVDGEIMEGENKYKCSTCDRHVDAVKRACLKDLPDNLIFHLKRFDFNLRTLQRSKINDYFAFPERIDMHPYTIEHLSDSSNEGEADVFELVGVLVHSGTAESGHYYSFIKERPTSVGRSDWVEFNDETVSPWDPELMESSTFGGPNHHAAYETNGIAFDKVYSAYMLFYQRVSTLAADQKGISERRVPAPVRSEMDVVLKDHIFSENTVFLRRHCLFDPSHTIFVQDCFTQAKLLDERDAAGSRDQDGDDVHNPSRHNLTDLAMDMALSHLDQIVSRTIEIPQFFSFTATIEAAVSDCADCGLAFCDYFHQRRGAFRAMLQRHIDPNVRNFTGRTLLKALKKVSADLPHVYGYMPPTNSTERTDRTGEWRHRYTERETSVMEGTAFIFNHLWRFFQHHLRSWDDYFGTVLAFAKLGDEEVAHLLANEYLLKLLRIIAADSVMELPANYTRMLQNVMRRANTRMPSYAAILGVIDYLFGQLEPELGAESIVETADDRREQSTPPFPWTSEEVRVVHYHPENHAVAFFAEKLIGIDQAPEVTSRIVARLINTGSQMDTRIWNALRKNLHGATSTQPMDPYLRQAGTFLENTQSSRQAQALIEHVSQQARHLQNNEGRAFVLFFTTVVALQRPDEEFREQARRVGLATIPDWAPYLLVDSDIVTRRDVSSFLAGEIFIHAPPRDFDEGGGDAETILAISRKLGIRCLLYLRDTHVKRRAQISQEAADSILQVITSCAPFYGVGTETDDDDIEFSSLQDETMIPLRRLIVDEVEDNGSEEWNGSGASSEVHDIAELSMNAMNEMIDSEMVSDDLRGQD